jgi:hypothetical protein
MIVLHINTRLGLSTPLNLKQLRRSHNVNLTVLPWMYTVIRAEDHNSVRFDTPSEYYTFYERY